MQLIWDLHCCMATINQHTRVLFCTEHNTQQHTPNTRALQHIYNAHDATKPEHIHYNEGRRVLSALLFLGVTLVFWFCPAALLARSVDEMFMCYCNKPDAPLPARQTGRTAFHRFYRSCCCYCSPPWWTAHSTARVRTPNGHMSDWPKTFLSEITALCEYKQRV